MQTFGRLTGGNFAAPLFCVAAVAVNQSIFRLGALPLIVAAAFLLTVAAIALMAPDLRLGAGQRAPLGWANALIGAVIVMPLLVTFALGWNRDFPFSGDHYFHVGQAYRLAFWWMAPPASPIVRVPTLADVSAMLRDPAKLFISRAALAVLVVAATAVIYRRHRLAALILASLSAAVWGLFEQTIFVRYPAGGYVAAMPFLGPAFLLHDVELGGRLANVLAPVLWLFVLRPWLVGRWPDLRVLAFGAVLFWQQDVIYFVDSVYIEPWAIVFCLVAIELLIDRGERGAALACLLIGAAATVKEPVIFALPLVWLAGRPWRAPGDEFRGLTGCAFAAGMSFVFYYIARTNVAAAEVGVEGTRHFRFGWPSGPLAPYVEQFAHRLSGSFTPASAFLYVAAIALLIVLAALWRERRLTVICVAAAGVLLIAFFMVDRDSLPWLGYFRFFLLAIPFVTAGALAFGHAAGPRWALAAGIAALLLQTPGAWLAVTRAAGPITAMNFIETYDAAIFFPMKSVIAEARGKGFLAANETVFANAPDTSLRVIPGIPVTYGAPGAAVCACSPEHPAVMGLYIRYANLDAPFSAPGSGAGRLPGDRVPLWRAATATRPACMAQLMATCAHVLERDEGGEPVAVLGTAR